MKTNKHGNPIYIFHCAECGMDDINFKHDEIETCTDCNGDGCECCRGEGERLKATPPVKYHDWARFDVYGIYTELCCNTCYDNGNYSYRTDEYFDESYAGERMDLDY